MNECITKLANDLTYAGTLQCADNSVASAIISIPNRKHLKQEQWLLTVLSDELNLSVVQLDTGNVYARTVHFAQSQLNDPSETLVKSFEGQAVAAEQKRTRIYTNYCEAAVALYVIDSLIKVAFFFNLLVNNLFYKNFIFRLALKVLRLVSLHRIVLKWSY